jgi:hypothetical protein
VTRSRIVAISCALAAAATLFRADAQAQLRRVVRAAPRSVVVVGAGFYRPFFYDPWYGWGAPYYGWYPPYYAYPPYGYPYGYNGSASLRLQVEPKQTEVFIDGYFAGTVDDFDGFFQRLHLEPGEHELQLYLPNYRTATQKIYLQPNATFRVKHEMQPIAAGEAPDPRPVPPPGAPARGGYGPPAGRNQPGSPASEGAARPEPSDRSSSFGTLAVRVQPSGAEVIVDGESWNGPEGAERLMIQLPEGEHRVEVRREGYAGYSSTVRVKRGETATLNVSLVRQ